MERGQKSTMGSICVFFVKLRFWWGDIYNMLRMWKYVKTPMGKKCFILGTPSHTNLGDSAIALAQRHFLESCGIPKKRIKEISFENYQERIHWFGRHIPSDSLITQLGGGNMGNQWMEEELLHRQQVEAFVRNPMVIFPQTVYYTQDSEGDTAKKDSVAVYNSKKDLTMTAREAKSFALMKEMYPDIHVIQTPDIVLSSSMEAFGARHQKRSGVLLLMRGDKERVFQPETKIELEAILGQQGVTYDYSDTHCQCTITKENREALVKDKLEQVASAKLVITDRLHGMIFAAVTGTPCIAFDNCSNKVRGSYEWIKYLPYIRFAESVEDVKLCLPDLMAMDDCVFDNTPLLPHFEELTEVVRKYASD